MAANKIWQQPVEVPATVLGRGRHVHQTEKWAMFCDLERRLECTGPGQAIAYPFEDEKTAAEFRTYCVRRMEIAHGTGSYRSALKQVDGRWCAIFGRGPKYKPTDATD